MRWCSVKRLATICKKHEIICYGYTEWLKELCKEDVIAERIKFIIDDNPFLWGKSVECGKRHVFVKNPMEINICLNKEDSIIITASYQEDLYKKVKGYVSDKKIKIYSCPSVQDRLARRFKYFFGLFPLQNIIVFRSGLGKYSSAWEYADNARALFEYMLEKGMNKKYKLVWMVKYPEHFGKLQSLENVKVISYDGETNRNILNALIYQYYIYCSKYFFFTETCYWLRYVRKKQITVNLWHGCGIKGRKAKTEPTGSHYNYMTVNSELYAQIHARDYGCKKEQMLITGLPKQDWLFQQLEKPIEELLQLPVGYKNIFWLPTFRKTQQGFENLNEETLNTETGLPLIENEALLEELNVLLGEQKTNLIVKLHPLQEKLKVSEKEFSNIFFVTNEKMEKIGYPINRVLSEADALISDYSSAAIDYMLLDRPIAFTLDDVHEYENSRGFNFDNVLDYLPGKELYSFEEMKKFIVEISRGIDSSKEKRQKLMQVLHKYTDGQNSKRILEYFKI